MIKNSVLIILLCSFFFLVSGQEQLVGPASSYAGLSNEIAVYNLPSFDIESRIAASENSDGALLFAEEFLVDLNTDNYGDWETANGMGIWRLTVSSAEAYSMMVKVEDMDIPPYSWLYVYNSDKSQVLGPYTESFGTKILTPLVQGDAITIELVYDLNLCEKNPSLAIKGAYHDYLNVFSVLQGINDGVCGDLLDCEIDVNCEIGSEWQLEKKAVVRVVHKN